MKSFSNVESIWILYTYIPYMTWISKFLFFSYVFRIFLLFLVCFYYHILNSYIHSQNPGLSYVYSDILPSCQSFDPYQVSIFISSLPSSPETIKTAIGFRHVHPLIVLLGDRTSTESLAEPVCVAHWFDIRNRPPSPRLPQNVSSLTPFDERAPLNAFLAPRTLDSTRRCCRLYGGEIPIFLGV